MGGEAFSSVVHFLIPMVIVSHTCFSLKNPVSLYPIHGVFYNHMVYLNVSLVGNLVAVHNASGHHAGPCDQSSCLSGVYQ